MLNHYTTKMTGPLATWIIHFRFLLFIWVYIHKNPYSHIDCPFTKIHAIWQYICNMLKHNTQYGIDPYCFTSNSHRG